uniref:Uncharacterized protein n=1 Tax=Trichobilharzia regenti TaxID=157069 RepID=A0AA85KAU7_TRIRE|nr:unnamed protein product [Trichobilharzia regenti]
MCDQPQAAIPWALRSRNTNPLSVSGTRRINQLLRYGQPGSSNRPYTFKSRRSLPEHHSPLLTSPSSSCFSTTVRTILQAGESTSLYSVTTNNGESHRNTPDSLQSHVANTT